MSNIKVLLLLPPVSLNEDKGIFPTYFPYFSLTCATHLKKNKYKTKIIDYYQKYKNKDHMKNEIVAYNPDLIGICVSEPTRYLPIETHNHFIKFINSISNAPIFIFGIFQKHILELYTKNSSIDHILYGDPEFSITQLVQTKFHKSITLMKVLGETKEDNIIPATINNLDNILPVDYSLIDYEQYKFNPHRYKSSKLHHMIISRGCPWGKCTFCEDMSLLKMAPYRYKSAENVISQIENLYNKKHINEIQFYDPQFVTDINWLQKFNDLIEQKQLHFKWSCLSRADKLDKKSLELMHKAGCWNIIIGIETLSKKLLPEINKGISIDQITKTIKLCKQYNIEVTGSFLLGLPNECPNDVFYSAKQAIKLGIDYVQFFIAKYSNNHKLVYKTSYQISSQVDYSQYDFIGTPLILENYRDLNHLKKTQQKAYKIFYLNFHTMLKMIKKVNSFADILRMLKGFFILLKIVKNNLFK